MIHVKTVQKGRDDEWKPFSGFTVATLRGQRVEAMSRFQGDRCSYILLHYPQRSMLFRCTWSDTHDGDNWDVVLRELRMVTTK